MSSPRERVGMASTANRFPNGKVESGTQETRKRFKGTLVGRPLRLPIRWAGDARALRFRFRHSGPPYCHPLSSILHPRFAFPPSSFLPHPSSFLPYAEILRLSSFLHSRYRRTGKVVYRGKNRTPPPR